MTRMKTFKELVWSCYHYLPFVQSNRLPEFRKALPYDQKLLTLGPDVCS